MLKKKYNIIFINLDGARYDRIKNLKNFKRLTKGSTLFSQMITYAPYTLASLHAIFTGSYGNRNGVDNFYSSPSFRKELFPTLATYLKKEGYYTVADILNPIIIPSDGFDEIKIHDISKNNLLKRHLELIDRMTKKEQKPFFLFLDYSKIQNSIKINVSKQYNNFSKEYFEQINKNLEAYDTYVNEADDYLGKILDEMDVLGPENFILIVNSDHGIGVGEKFGEKSYGVYCYDYTLKTFAVFCNPVVFPKKEIKQLVRTIDIMPTILDYLGIEKIKGHENMNGKSMKNFIEGDKEDRVSFSESGNPYPDPKIPPKKPNVRAIRTSRWKFIKNYWNDSEELYDLEKDPDETNNLVKKNPKVVSEMNKRLNSELKEGLKIKIKMVTKNIK